MKNPAFTNFLVKESNNTQTLNLKKNEKWQTSTFEKIKKLKKKLNSIVNRALFCFYIVMTSLVVAILTSFTF
jgi:hypothetical protein